MVTHYIWQNANPNYEVHLRRANEARAAAIYAGWKRVVGALGGVFRRYVEARRRAARARETEQALRALNDRQLGDIGVTRAEIASVAEAAASQPAGVSVTLADLPRLRSAAGTGGAAERRVREGARRVRPAPWAAKRPAAAAAARSRAA